VVQTLFNQPHPARAEVPWQPHAGIAQKLSSRGYATTSWTHDEPIAFAELDYPTKSSGFSAAHYQPTRQPLTQQAQASLALLERECRNESVSEETPQTPAVEQTNEHLPFVMDDFGATRKSKLRVKVDPKVLTRALAQAELAEGLVVSPITSDDQGPELIVIHPDEPSTDEVIDHALVPSVQATQAIALASEEVAPESEVVEELIETEPAVVGGIAPDEVAQREAEQFAKGMAQAREEASVELAAAIEKAMAEGFEKGHQEGLAQGLEQGKAEGLDEGQALGMAQGLEEGKAHGLTEGVAQGLEQGKELGEREAREAVAEEMAAQRVVFENVAHELSALIEDPKKFFDPLKRLAIHIAEQVVVGELQTSSKAIERLVQRCLDELDHPVQGAVVLELNPEDKDLLQAQGGEFTKGMRLESMHDMPRGSVRVFANDTVVEDLVNHRLEGLARSLLVDVEAWRETSPLAQPLLEVEEEAEDGDVHS
jgi:flagellar biosynthesis/type III secretory pathway protein FliH